MSFKADVSLTSLLKAGCHFGHTTARFNPKNKPFVYTIKNRVIIFDLAQTRQRLVAAADFLYQTASNGGEIIFIGTKRQAADIIKTEAQKAGVFYVNSRWLGGTLTNWPQISARIKFLTQTQAALENGEFDHYTKLERLRLERQLKKLDRFLGGLVGFSGKPAALVVADVKKDVTAVREARQLKVPVVAVVDSNVDPEWVDYPIPANDDAIASIKLIMEQLGQAVAAGVQEYHKKSSKIESKPKKAKKASSTKSDKKSSKKGGQSGA